MTRKREQEKADRERKIRETDNYERKKHEDELTRREFIEALKSVSRPLSLKDEKEN